MDVELAGVQKVVAGRVVEEMVVKGPIVEEILGERFAKEEPIEGLAAENMVNKKMQVDPLLVKLLGTENA